MIHISVRNISHLSPFQAFLIYFAHSLKAHQALINPEQKYVADMREASLKVTSCISLTFNVHEVTNMRENVEDNICKAFLEIQIFAHLGKNSKAMLGCSKLLISSRSRCLIVVLNCREPLENERSTVSEESYEFHNM